MKKIAWVTGLFLSITLCAASVPADVRLPAVIDDNMVLQRDMEVPLWGWADPGEEVTVAIDRSQVTVTAGSGGTWMVRLAPLQAGGPYEMTIRGRNTISLTNVMVGEVWLCSGQSNMEMKVAHCADSVDEIAEAFYPNIRLFQVTNAVAPEPLDDCEAEWQACRPSTVGDFSGTAYFFGREIMRELDVPVGLIHASWGETPIEPWMSREAFAAHPEFNSTLLKWGSVLDGKPPEAVAYYATMGRWIEDLYYAMSVGKPFPVPVEPPESPVELTTFPSMPMWVYNAMIAPLIPYAIRGAIWYQGESNAGHAFQYRKLFPAMIENWRSRWGQDDFSFVYVQLANYMKPDAEPRECAWAELREAQLMALTLPQTAMAVTIDIGEAEDIHPRNKQDVGRRLALGALKAAYRKGVIHSGPLYDSMNVQDGKVHIRFTEMGSGLMVKGDGPLLGFAIAGEDRKFVWADANIEGDEVVVWSDEVTQPLAVRYAWANNPVCNLYNREGLPASPFRTDNWPGVTENNR